MVADLIEYALKYIICNWIYNMQNDTKYVRYAQQTNAYFYIKMHVLHTNAYFIIFITYLCLYYHRLDNDLYAVQKTIYHHKTDE